MQPPTNREIVTRLNDEGFVEIRNKGGRRIFRKGARVVTVHGNDNSRPLKGTYGAIKRQAGW